MVLGLALRPHGHTPCYEVFSCVMALFLEYFLVCIYFAWTKLFRTQKYWFVIKISRYKSGLEDKSGHLRKKLNIFIRKLMKTKTVETGNSGSLYCVPNNSLNTNWNAMKLILNENRLVEISIHIKYMNFGLKLREIQIFKLGYHQMRFYLRSLYKKLNNLSYTKHFLVRPSLLES